MSKGDFIISKCNVCRRSMIGQFLVFNSDGEGAEAAKRAERLCKKKCWEWLKQGEVVFEEIAVFVPRAT